MVWYLQSKAVTTIIPIGTLSFPKAPRCFNLSLKKSSSRTNGTLIRLQISVRKILIMLSCRVKVCQNSMLLPENKQKEGRSQKKVEFRIRKSLRSSLKSFIWYMSILSTKRNLKWVTIVIVKIRQSITKIEVGKTLLKRLSVMHAAASTHAFQFSSM